MKTTSLLLAALLLLLPAIATAQMPLQTHSPPPPTRQHGHSPDSEADSFPTQPTQTVTQTQRESFEYEWRYDDWEECNDDNAACGSGNRYRVSQCVYKDPQGNWFDEPDFQYCQIDLGQADYSEDCRGPRCVEYRWEHTDYGPCTECGGNGQRQRERYCADPSNARVPDLSCQLIEENRDLPLVAYDCATQVCETFSWAYGAWSACSLLCGSGVGTQTRSKTCVNQNNVPEDPRVSISCSSFALVEQSCTASQACETFQYVYSDWSACSGCGDGGTQIRTRSCVNNLNVPALESYCASTFTVNSNMPMVQACAASQACETFQYVYSDWASCSVSCGGGGTQARTRSCVNNFNMPAQESACASSLTANANMPVTQTCAALTQCETYQWIYGAYSACSVSCGNDGTRSRVRFCNNQAMQFRANSFCAGLADESLIEACAAPAPCDTYQVRQYFLSLVFSFQLTRCTFSPSHSLTPDFPLQWALGSWGFCSATCGNGGVQTRDAYCNNQNFEYRFDAICAAAGVAAPAESQRVRSCQPQPQACDVYSWRTGAFGACSGRFNYACRFCQSLLALHLLPSTHSLFNHVCFRQSSVASAPGCSRSSV
jgi:hypothetical protein